MSKMKMPAGKSMISWLLPFYLLSFFPITASGQRLLTLDSCRALGLRNNKQMRIAEVKQDVAKNIRQAARTKYLPHVSAIGTYEHTSREVSILNDSQKQKLSHLGTTMATGIGAIGQSSGISAAMQGNPLGQALEQQMSQTVNTMAGVLNQFGQEVVDAFRTDSRNIWAGSILLTQPLFMGGSIVAANKMADISEDMAYNRAEAQRQATLYNIDKAYWQVVSLNHKKKLAEGYRDLVKKLDNDVNMMIAEGVATRSDGLSVSVKVNEAEMALTQVNDGLVLSKMLLCQLCGLPVNEQITLADENMADLSDVLSMNSHSAASEMPTALANRPELKLLQNAIDLSHQSTNLMKAGNLPQVALTGGYAISNPNVLNGFEKKFSGFWHVGVMLRVPIWNWGDVKYKVRASKGATAIANLELEEAREMIELQVSQNSFRVDEANKKLTMAKTNIERAEENLRTANLGSQEGVITPTTVMEAQTAWLQAQSQKIDAEIDVRLSHVELQKSLGVLE